MKYDNIEINLDEFLRLIDEDSITYLLELGWSNKTKRAWQESLANIINGLIESSNVASTGPYAGLRVIHTTNNLNTESFNKKLNEIYLDVTWFLNQEMKKFIQLKNQELQKQEVKKDTTLPKFTNELFNIDLNKIIASDRYGGQKFTTSLWTSLDERDETGKRGTSERSKLLASYLRKYADEVSGKYDFTDSPFESEDDLKERINAAIKSLEDGVWNKEDIDNLNRVGINPDLYFDNGLNDVRGTIEGKPITYGEYNDFLQEYKLQKIALQNKENEEKRKAMLKKVQDAKREISEWAKRPTTPVVNTQESPKYKDVKFTDADYADITGLIMDISSLVYPGAIGGVVLGTAGATARTAAASMRGDVNFWDRLLDFGTGIAGAIPIIGDMAMVGKIGRGLRGFLLTSGLIEAALLLPELSSAVGKVMSQNYSDITVDEWKGFLKFFRGVAGASRVYKSNLQIAKSAELSGLKVENKLRNKILGFGPKIEKGIAKKFIKAKVKVGEEVKDVDVPVEKEEYDELVKKLSRIGQGEKGLIKRQKVVKEVAEPKIKKMEGMSGVKSEDITIAYTPTWRNMRPLPFKDNSSHFKTTYENPNIKTDEEFEEALKLRDSWDKIGALNKNLRYYRKKFKLSDITKPTTSPNVNTGGAAEDLIGRGIIENPRIKNILEPPERLTRRLTRIIKKGNSHIIEAPDGSKINVSYNGSNIEVTHNGTTNTLTGDLHILKLQLSKIVNDITNRIITTPSSSQRTTELWNKFIKGLLDAKKKGFFLKRGGMVKNKYIL